MCGRLNVIDDPICIAITEILGIQLRLQTNTDLRPTQKVSTIANIHGSYQQLDLNWGIKPQWSKTLLINAQAETAATKPTFKQALAERRCLVPCTGWYEWRDEGRSKKQKYLFSPQQGSLFLMAGIYYPGTSDSPASLVTLTTEPTPQFKNYHHRMPLLIAPENINYWFQAKPNELQPLLSNSVEFEAFAQ
ncbi:SOS response-associated peptidase [uncultured Rheinheimera sp.]|uniref:SOS response-associated peptidase n=1 Tax=uncultured Rheinheimera sp. TaxID=400532 RepID=UPI00259A68A4|nr:SOS response-associated peptidase [uncultured Rheinheimera sp.]